MRRRVLGLCLVAYPRASRLRDREYLRDLALDLAERRGLVRQALSLVVGGLEQRVSRARASVWRIGLVAGVLVALAFTTSALVASAESDHDLERLACVGDHGSGRGCADAERRVRARERAGWNCTTRAAAKRSMRWECVRAS